MTNVMTNVMTNEILNEEQLNSVAGGGIYPPRMLNLNSMYPLKYPPKMQSEDPTPFQQMPH